MWGIDEKSVNQLIEMIDKSELGLPQFQRPSVWGQSNWVPFLMTVILGRPTGALLLLETGDDSRLAPRQLESAPDLIAGRLKFHLLDGQQRTTTLYRATRTTFGKGRQLKKAVVDVRSALERGNIEEEDVTLISAAAVPDAATMAEDGKVAFSTLVNAVELAGWQHSFVTSHFDGDAARFQEAVLTAAPGLLMVGQYRFPVLKIERDTPLDVVAEIFEGMNRRGQPLNKFDLMVAKLYQDMGNGKYYDLRDSWEKALDNSPHLKQIGVTNDDGMLPLQVIAMQVSRLGDPARGRVKGIASASVLELPVRQVMGDASAQIPGVSLESAIQALEKAAEFLVTVCGVTSPSLLPQQAMLLPLADRFIQSAGPGLTAAQMKKWFFSVGLAINYYGGVNSYVERDCKLLKRWADPSSAIEPDSVKNLTRSMVENLDLRQQFSREGNILGRAVFALLVTNGAVDWSAGQIPLRTKDDVDFHHMVPDQRLKNWYPAKEDRRPIAGLTPICAPTNRSIGNRLPDDVMNERGNDAGPIADSHRVDRALLDAASTDKVSFEKFVVDREKRLKEFIIQALGL
jgi:hypothetical protein